MFERSGDLAHPIITVDVDDIDVALERIVGLGGAVVQAKTAIPGMGYSATSATPRATSSDSGPRRPTPPDRSRVERQGLSEITVFRASSV